MRTIGTIAVAVILWSVAAVVNADSNPSEATVKIRNGGNVFSGTIVTPHDSDAGRDSMIFQNAQPLRVADNRR